jgi:hypothetical protein
MTLADEPFTADLALEQDSCHDLVRHFGTAFLLAELTDIATASRALATNIPDSSGVTLTSQGTRNAGRHDAQNGVFA